MTREKTVSDFVSAGEWDKASDTMMNPDRCFIGEKYRYHTFPSNEKWPLESLARDVIASENSYAWSNLIRLRDSMAKFLKLHVKTEGEEN